MIKRYFETSYTEVVSVAAILPRSFAKEKKKNENNVFKKLKGRNKSHREY